MMMSFPNVHHVILDEVQNYRSEDGDWLEKARTLVLQHCPNPRHDSGVVSDYDSNWTTVHLIPILKWISTPLLAVLRLQNHLSRSRLANTRNPHVIPPLTATLTLTQISPKAVSQSLVTPTVPIQVEARCGFLSIETK